MIIKTMVALRKNGIAGTKWADYLQKKSKLSSCTPVYSVVQGKTLADNGVIPYINRWLETGVARHTIFSTLRYHKPKEMVLLADTVVRRFNTMTGRYGMVNLYSAHYDTPFPHVHVLQASSSSSQVYVNKQELDYLYAIASFVFDEPIGAKAYLRLFNERMARAKNPVERMKISGYEKETIQKIKDMQGEINKELKTMAEHTII